MNTQENKITTEVQEGMSASTDSVLCLISGTGQENPGEVEDKEGMIDPNVNPEKATAPVLLTGECFFEGAILQDFEDLHITNPCNLCNYSFAPA